MNNFLKWLALIIFVGLSIFLSWWFFFRQQPVSTPQNPQPHKTERQATRVAYIKDNNVFTNKIQGGDEKQITNDGKQQATKYTYYAEPKYVDADNLKYLKCDRDDSGVLPKNPCQIIEHNLKTDTKTTAVSANFIVRFDWFETLIAYYTKATEKTSDLLLYDSSTKKTTTFKNYPTNFGRGGASADYIGLNFNTDGKYLLFNDTTLHPSTKKKTPVLEIFDVAKVKAVYSFTPLSQFEGYWYSFANWAGNDSFVYKNGNNDTPGLYIDSLATKKPKLLTKDNGEDLAVSPDNNVLAYWKPETKGTSLRLLDMAELTTSKALDNALFPFFVSNTDLVTEDTKACEEGECEPFDLYNGYIPASKSTRTNVMDKNSAPYFFKSGPFDASVLWEEVVVQ